MTTLAVVPVKRLSIAKRRLRHSLDDGARRRLAAAMAGDVLSTLSQVPGIDGVIVVSADPEARSIARAFGAELVHDPFERGPAPAALTGIERAVERGAERVLVVAGDCATADADEIATLLGASESVVIVPDCRGAGTNALLLRPPGAIAPAYGRRSRSRHERAARAAGRDVSVRPLASLSFDIDLPADLERLRAGSAGGPLTRAALVEMGQDAGRRR